jgi:Uma2 family endonuclease
MSAAAARLTPQQYLEIERASKTKSEFFAGQMFAMSGGTRSHSLIAGNLLAALHLHLADSSCEVHSSDLRVKCEAAGLYTYPDVTVACGETHFEDPVEDTLLSPTIVIEVLSPSTEAYDRGAKFRHYREIETLQEYVLVSQDAALVEHYLRQPDNTWRLSEARGLDAMLELPTIGCTLPLRTIYQRVRLDQPTRP